MKNYEELYNALVFELERAKNEAVVLYKDYKEEGLTFNAGSKASDTTTSIGLSLKLLSAMVLSLKKKGTRMDSFSRV
jgi:hypothetical protein